MGCPGILGRYGSWHSSKMPLIRPQRRSAEEAQNGRHGDRDITVARQRLET
jgi:hypothetical protein